MRCQFFQIVCGLQSTAKQPTGDGFADGAPARPGGDEERQVGTQLERANSYS